MNRKIRKKKNYLNKNFKFGIHDPENLNFENAHLSDNPILFDKQLISQDFVNLFFNFFSKSISVSVST